jgi:hypothetical protein
LQTKTIAFFWPLSGDRVYRVSILSNGAILNSVLVVFTSFSESLEGVLDSVVFRISSPKLVFSLTSGIDERQMAGAVHTPESAVRVGFRTLRDH